MENEENEKNEAEFVCINCDFKCCFKSDFNRHLSTRKHSDSLNGNLVEMKLSQVSKAYICEQD